MLLSESEINLTHRSTINSTAILAKNLSKHVVDVTNKASANKIEILNDLNLQVAHGESIAIVGSSGSGKSTLLALLAGLDVPTAGSVEVSGRSFSTLDEDARAAMRGAQMGFVFQSFQLLPTMTALENVMLPMQLANRKDAKQMAVATLEKVGLAERLQHYPKQLSGGEQQRVAIARAFAPKPAILFADEPTGNLDIATGECIIELLFSLNRQANTTLILVTHDVQLAQRCRRQLTLQHGQLSAI
ncbi:MAG TPA: ABC transporter ATP-binding protein [Methylotenera sp.]|nr:ABC transporter ATP-binding protein [Methylotenera sp.]HPV45568.1 ABC transporter ATP-binding protein [Methylotenera sp.]